MKDNSSDELLKVGERVKDFNRVITLLKALRRYYVEGLNLDELAEEAKIPLREVILFMNESSFGRKSEIEEEIGDIILRIDDRIKHLEEDIRDERASLVEKLNSILLIYSWSKAINLSFPGFYAGQMINKVEQDSIIMLTDQTQTYAEITGQEVVVLTGAGLYFSKFLVGGGYVYDQREINGIALPMESLESLFNAEKIYQSDKIDAQINEMCSMIPFTLITQPSSVQAFVRGVFSRNIFLPYKETFDSLLRHCESAQSYVPEEGFKILSGAEPFANKILVSQEFAETGKGREYCKPTAGLSNIIPALDKILYNIFPDPQKIKERVAKINELKTEFVKVGHILLKEWIPS